MTELAQIIDQVEALQFDDVEAARKILRLFLLRDVGGGEKGSFGDALASLSVSRTEHRELACVIVRCLAISHLIPEANESNHIARNVVEISLGSLPDLCDFLGLSAAYQTYENFEILRGAHARICSILAPLKKEKTTLELFLASRHPIVQCLNHSAIKAYCAPFGLTEVTNKVEQIFSIIRRITTSDQFALNHQIKIFNDETDEGGNPVLKQAVQSEVPSLDTNSFAHLWQDGIFRVGSEREPQILQRCRVLVAAARTMRRGDVLTLDGLVANKHSPNLAAADISPIINDFMRREILAERDGRYDFTLPLFGLWLKDVGITRLISDALAQELAEVAQAEEDRSYVQSDEISSLVGRWHTYRGKKIGSDEVRAWFEQASSHKDQRLLFTLLQNMKFFGEIEIREKLKTAFSFLRPMLPDFVIKKKSDRRTNIVVTYVDGEGKSGQYYASRFAEENRILTRSIISPVRFSSLLENYLAKNGVISVIVVVDDIVATGGSLSKKLRSFVHDNETILKNLNVPLVAIALTATSDGEETVREAMTEFDWLDFDLRTCEPLTEEMFAFRQKGKMWRNKDDFDRALALCRDLGANIYRDTPLGYGDQALLIAFPETCPNNTLPIIHSASRQGAARKWLPLLPRVTN